jgi:hypothetical protein
MIQLARSISGEPRQGGAHGVSTIRTPVRGRHAGLSRRAKRHQASEIVAGARHMLLQHMPSGTKLRLSEGAVRACERYMMKRIAIATADSAIEAYPVIAIQSDCSGMRSPTFLEPRGS